MTFPTRLLPIVANYGLPCQQETESAINLGIDISINLDILVPMELINVTTALSVPDRLEMLKGLKDTRAALPR